MRLLRLEGGGVSLVEHFGEDIPPYAILSHTWGEETEEVTFKDLTLADGAMVNKGGYKKIRFCGEQAKKDGLEYFWVDTCSIDKSSSAELSEAINSMFRWYQNAAKCYVYLSDVSSGSAAHPIIRTVDGEPCSQTTWKQAFPCSKWFTRSWTLQELIAPAIVEFFSAEGRFLEDKEHLLEELHDITKVPTEVLSLQESLSEISIEERMKWAQGRRAKREEDIAYSLLGLFDIHMPLIYGEGKRKAFGRLYREIETAQMTDWRAQERMPSADQEKSRYKSSSALAASKDPYFVEHSDFSSRNQAKRASPANRTGIRDSSRSSPLHSLGATRTVETRPDSPLNAVGHTNQFNTFNGTQNNNTGSGVQFLGSFIGSMIFSRTK